MVILQSRTLQAVAYDEERHLLRAKFRLSGETLIFRDVPRDVYDSLIFADSIGAYFRDHIYGHYPVSKI